MMEENAEIVEVETKLPVVVEAEVLSAVSTKKDLRQEIQEILAVSFVCESGALRQGEAMLPVAKCMEVYRKNPFVFFYINKQVSHVMAAIKKHRDDAGRALKST